MHILVTADMRTKFLAYILTKTYNNYQVGSFRNIITIKLLILRKSRRDGATRVHISDEDNQFTIGCHLLWSTSLKFVEQDVGSGSIQCTEPMPTHRYWLKGRPPLQKKNCEISMWCIFWTEMSHALACVEKNIGCKNCYLRIKETIHIIPSQWCG